MHHSEPPSEPPGSQTALLRTLDAALNRAVEGLRVVEDYLRFALDDRHLLEMAKDLRHAISDQLKGVLTHQRYVARDTASDVGTSVTIASEVERRSLREVAAANMKRAQQAVRSLEEYSKLLNPTLAATMESLRYRLYILERAIEITGDAQDGLSGALLYVLVDGRRDEAQFERCVQSLISAGVHVLQFRDKSLTDRELIGRARILRNLTANTDTLCIINDRPDIALAVRADGVHVGQDELSVKDVRVIVGLDAVIGVSTHSIEQARAAVLDGANYIGVGPVFPSPTKGFDRFVGTDLLRTVAAEISLPSFAIGGITLEKLDEVVSAGFTRVAVSGAVIDVNDPALAAGEFLKRLQTAATARSLDLP